MRQNFPHHKTRKEKTHLLTRRDSNKPHLHKYDRSRREAGKPNASSCLTITEVDPSFKPESRADVWWWCGDPQLYDRLPGNWTGMCGLVSLLLPVQVIKLSATDITITAGQLKLEGRKKRSAPVQPGPDPTYVDAIGIPRGVPDEYKLVDQVAAGFESSIQYVGGAQSTRTWTA